MSSNLKAAERKEVFKQVLLTQLQTRTAGVIRGSAEGPVVCPMFISDCALIAESILSSAEQFALGTLVTKPSSAEASKDTK